MFAYKEENDKSVNQLSGENGGRDSSILHAMTSYFNNSPKHHGKKTMLNMGSNLVHSVSFDALFLIDISKIIACRSFQPSMQTPKCGHIFGKG